jgi:hypothetical protein
MLPRACKDRPGLVFESGILCHDGAGFYYSIALCGCGFLLVK